MTPPKDLPGEVRPSRSVLWRRLSLATLGLTFALVVLGAVVRITGSGMGCGDDWPLCNGQLIPTGDLATFLEWGHRLVALLVSLLVVSLAAVAWKPGRPGSWEADRRLSAAALALLIVQVLLGAITVWLELPPGSVILHLGTAMALLGVLVVGTLRAYRAPARRPAGPDGATRIAGLFVATAFVVVLAGALVANLDATAACRGFPLCGDRWWPAGSGPAQIQWGHRLLAYAFALGVLFLPTRVGAWRPDDRAAQGMAFALVAVVLSQIAVGAVLVTGPLTLEIRTLHMGLGTAVFGLTVALAWMIRRPVGYSGGERAPAGRRGGRGPDTSGAVES